MPVILAGNTSGSTTLQATDAVTATITLPSATGTVQLTGGAVTTTGINVAVGGAVLSQDIVTITGGGSSGNFKGLLVKSYTGDEIFAVNNLSYNVSMGAVAGNLKTGSTISVGNATPSASGAGITFPATQSASTDANTLDDYEEGTWTPNQGAGLTGTLSSSTGTYTKIGRQVYITAVYNGTTLAFTANTVISSNLPFSLAGISGAFNFGVATNANFTAFSGVGTSTSGTSLYGISALTSTAAIELSFTYIAS